jgi:hypothetical protein
MAPNNDSNNRYVIEPKKKMEILIKRLFYSYTKKYSIAISSLWLLSWLTSTILDFHVPLVSILFIVALSLVVDLEYILGLLASEKLIYNDNRIIKTKHGNFQIPNNPYLLAIPFIDNMIRYILYTKKHNLLFKTSLYNTIQKNVESNRKQEIIFYTCNLCTRLIIEIDVRTVIIKENFVTFDLGFISSLSYDIIIQDDNGKTLENIPKYKLECIKETISKNILEEDIDIFCRNNDTNLFEFLNSFFFVYWLTANYLLHAPERKVLV